MSELQISDFDTKTELRELKKRSQEQMSELQKKNSELKTELIELQNKNSDMNTELKELNQRSQAQQSRIANLSHTGTWCAYQDRWTTGFALINYDTILHADSNMIKNTLNVGNGEI